MTKMKSELEFFGSLLTLEVAVQDQLHTISLCGPHVCKQGILQLCFLKAIKANQSYHAQTDRSTCFGGLLLCVSHITSVTTCIIRVYK